MVLHNKTVFFARYYQYFLIDFLAETFIKSNLKWVREIFFSASLLTPQKKKQKTLVTHIKNSWDCCQYSLGKSRNLFSIDSFMMDQKFSGRLQSGISSVNLPLPRYRKNIFSNLCATSNITLNMPLFIIQFYQLNNEVNIYVCSRLTWFAQLVFET